MPWRRPHRFWRHLATDHRRVRRAFPTAGLERIEAVIAAGEERHRGQVRFAVEPALPLARVMHGAPPRVRALEVFGLLRIWDTAENCGVLVYLLLADRDVEIVADRGIHAAVGAAAWEAVCRKMEAAFTDGRFVEGVEAGIAEINALLAQHFPRDGRTGGNELSDRPIVL
ncbi:MAG: TPM domain-containing protein [Betaproteobacteria bacterium]